MTEVGLIDNKTRAQERVCAIGTSAGNKVGSIIMEDRGWISLSLSFFPSLTSHYLPSSVLLLLILLQIHCIGKLCHIKLVSYIFNDMERVFCHSVFALYANR